MVTISLEDEVFDRLVEEYGEDVARQYGEGLREISQFTHGDADALANIEDARGAHEEVSVGALGDQQYDSLEELVDDVERRVEEFEQAIRLYAAQEYLISQIEGPEELE